MSSVQAFTEDLKFEVKIASFYEPNRETRMDLVRSLSALMEAKGKEHNFLVWRAQMLTQEGKL